MPIAFLAASVLSLGPVADDGRALQPVPFQSVTFEGGFWGERLAVVREATVPHNFELCESTGRLANLTRAGDAVQAGRLSPPPGGYEGYFFNDSDVYKAIEAACYQLAQHPDPALEATIDAVITDIAHGQHPDGYINAHFTLTGLDKRWTNEAVMHETYCIGHLIEAGIAHFQATGKRVLLDVAIRAADHLAANFGPDKRHIVPGHQEVELALLRLYHITGDARHLETARFFLEDRGTSRPDRKLYGDYCQDHAPLRDHAEIVGHAVRSMYLYAAVADLCAIERDAELEAMMERIWTDLTERKMYITGGIGNSAHNEGFTRPFDLPNETGYAETCAALGLAFWSHRLNLLYGDARYFDTFERVIHNGALSGLSLDGKAFFYENPLATRGEHQRQPWYACACCPPNIARFFSSLGGYAYASAPGIAAINLYAAGSAKIDLGGGRSITLTQQTDYPWAGRVRILVKPEKPGEAFQIRLRIPGWCQGATIRINSNLEAYRTDLGYAVLTRPWKDGDTIDLDLPMAARRIQADPRIPANLGRIALQRGPIVYCAEAADNPDGVYRLVLPAGSRVEPRRSEGLLNNIVTLHGFALLPGNSSEDDRLYTTQPEMRQVPFTAIPYFAWANRKPGEMQVWIAESASVLPPGPLPGATPSASHSWRGDSVLAICDRLEPASSADHSVPRLTWWDHKGTEEWAQLTFESPRTLTGIEVYWFDDGEIGGGCRIPASWSAEVLAEDGAWRAAEGVRVNPVVKDAFCRASFRQVTTKGIRVRVKLREGFSGGVLELRPLR